MIKVATKFFRIGNFSQVHLMGERQWVTVISDCVKLMGKDLIAKSLFSLKHHIITARDPEFLTSSQKHSFTLTLQCAFKLTLA